jgi:hypothetical protein
MTADEEFLSRLAALFSLMLGAIAGFAVGVAVGMSHGSGCAVEAEQQKGMEQRKAADASDEAPTGHWVVNPQTGERVFVYGKDGAP